MADRGSGPEHTQRRLFWVITLTSFLAMSLVDMNLITFGLLYLELEASFNVSSFAIGWILSAYFATSLFIGMVAPRLLRRYSFLRVGILATLLFFTGSVLAAITPNFYCLYLFHGVMTGAATTLFYCVLDTILLENVKTYVSLATAIAYTGYSASLFISPLIYRVLVENYSWRGAYLLQAAMTAHLLPVIMVQTSVVRYMKSRGQAVGDKHNSGGMVETNGGVVENNLDGKLDSLLEPKENINNLDGINIRENTMDLENPHTNNNLNSSKPGQQRRPVWRCSTWELLLSLGYFMYILGQSFVRYMIGARLDMIGLNKQEIVTVLMTAGAANMFRVFPSYLTDRLNLNKIAVTGNLFLIMGIAACVSTVSTSFIFVMVYFALWGCLIGLVTTILFPSFVEVFGKERVPEAVGARLTVYSIGNCISPQLSGIVLDALGNINLLILLFGGLQISAGFIVLIVAYCRPGRKPREMLKGGMREGGK